MIMVRIMVRISTALFLLAVATGCKTIPALPPEIIAETYATHPGEGTPQVWDALWSESLASDDHFVKLLEQGDEALLARVNLIRSARHSIRIQTFIWSNDESGRLIMWELIKAVKQRGVDVEVIADHLFSDQDPATLAYLSTLDPKLRIKIYNPATDRLQAAALDILSAMVSDFTKLNLRMHNKVLLVDDRYAIVGGRNYANEYFDRTIGLNFKDRDVVIVGPVAADIRRSYDGFAGFEWVFPVEALEDVHELRESGDYSRWSTGTDFALYGLFDDIHEQADDAVAMQLLAEQFDRVGSVEFIADVPIKESDGDATTKRITRRLLALVNGARDSIVIQSPYLALSSAGIDAFGKLQERTTPPRVLISTNSLAATDSWMTYAISYKQKRIYIEDLKFDIREFAPLPHDIADMMSYDALLTRLPTPHERDNLTKAKFDLDPSLPTARVVDAAGRRHECPDRRNLRTGTRPFLCLHQKSFVIDDETAYVGSFNLDPRSKDLNTESGVVIRDRVFAGKLSAEIRRDCEPQNSFRVCRRRQPATTRELNATNISLWERLDIDLWPIRHTSSFRLRSGKEPVEPHDERFYDHWEDVGSFPLLGLLSSKVIYARLFKAFGGVLIPLV